MNDPPPPFESVAGTTTSAVLPAAPDITALRDLILSNMQFIQHYETSPTATKYSDMDMVVPRCPDGRYMAMLFGKGKMGGREKLYEGAKDYAMVQAVQNLFDVVGDKLFQTLKAKRFVEEGRNRGLLYYDR